MPFRLQYGCELHEDEPVTAASQTERGREASINIPELMRLSNVDGVRSGISSILIEEVSDAAPMDVKPIRRELTVKSEYAAVLASI